MLNLAAAAENGSTGRTVSHGELPYGRAAAAEVFTEEFNFGLQKFRITSGMGCDGIVR